MKKPLFIFTAFIFFICLSCNQKTDIKKEKEAILKVMQDKADAYVQNDLNRFLENYIQDSTSVRLTDSIIYIGWSRVKDIYVYFFEEKKAQTDFQNWTNLKENAFVKVAGDCAWVICDNTMKYDYKGEPSGYSNIEIAFLEKIDNKWKLSFNAFISGSLIKGQQPPL